MADLVFHNTTTSSYSPNGEWYLYKYYADMVGERVDTAASADAKSDVFAVVDGGVAKILTGTRSVQGTYEVVVSGLTRLGLPKDGTVQVHTRRFDWAGAKVDVGGPVDLGNTTMNYSSDTVSDIILSYLIACSLKRRLTTISAANNFGHLPYKRDGICFRTLQRKTVDGFCWKNGPGRSLGREYL